MQCREKGAAPFPRTSIPEPYANAFAGRPARSSYLTFLCWNDGLNSYSFARGIALHGRRLTNKFVQFSFMPFQRVPPFGQCECDHVHL